MTAKRIAQNSLAASANCRALILPVPLPPPDTMEQAEPSRERQSNREMQSE